MTAQENLARFQEIANRGLQDNLDPDKRARFDEALRRGLITQQVPRETLPEIPSETIGEGNNPIGDVAANLLTGAVALPVSGIAGIAGTLLPGEQGQGARFQEATQNALTSDLKTPGGRALMAKLAGVAGEALDTKIETPTMSTGFSGLENFGKVTPGKPTPLEPSSGTLREALAAPSEGTFEATGSPLAATIVKTLPAALLEAIPALRVGKTVFNRAAVKGKIPDESLPEFSEAIKAQGIKPEDVLDPEQLDKLKRFSDLGTTPTRGELNKGKPESFKQLKEEKALLEASDEAGESFRSVKLEQSQKIREAVDKQVDSLGVPDDVGASIKQALSSRKAQLKETRKAAYEGFREALKGSDIPLITSNLLEGLPDPGDIKTIKSLKPSESKAFDDLLQEFGIVEGGKDVTPLSMKNFEGFRRRLNSIANADQTGQMGVIISPIRKALDDEIELAFKSVEGGKNPNLSLLAKEARQSHANLKTEFDEKSIVNQLVSNKKRSNLEVLEDSKVYQKLASKALPVEDVTRLVNSLTTQGAKGQKALGNLQSAMLLDLIDSAYGASSRQIQGVRTFGGGAFQKRYQVLEPKLKVIFKNNPQAFKKIKDLSKTAEDLIVPSGAVPKGSAAFLIDIAQNVGLMKLAAIPGIREVIGAMSVLGKRTTNPIALKKAMKLNPELKKQVKTIQEDYPSLAIALGVGQLGAEDGSTTGNP